MDIASADVVRSTQGRDSGELFYVLTVEDGYAYIVNGRERRVEKAKKKKLKHLELVGAGEGRVAQKLRGRERVTNSEIRRALAQWPGASEG